jgi:hypothetical protein
MATHSAENSIPAEFDAGVFWITYKTRIITFAALLIVALLLVATFQMAQHRKATYSRELLNSSSTPSEYQMVIDRYPGTMAAGNAHLLLAAKQREEGKYEDAIATLESFVRNYPDHPLVGGAELSIGKRLWKRLRPLPANIVTATEHRRPCWPKRRFTLRTANQKMRAVSSRILFPSSLKAIWFTRHRLNSEV